MLFSGIAGPKFTKFLYDIEASFALLMRTLRSRYRIPFWIDRAISAGWVGNFDTKLVAMATSLKLSEKEGRTDHPQFNTYHMLQRL